MDNKIYLGDGAYCEFDGFQFRLWTERVTGIHEVFLEPDAYVRFRNFAERFLKGEEL